VRKKAPQARPVSASTYVNQLNQALSQLRSKQYQVAAQNLFSLGRRPELRAQRPQIKYALGVALMEMDMFQVAAFQFVDVIRSGDSKFARQSIEKLSLVANELGDDTILDYAISKVTISDIPPRNRDMIYYRLGDIKAKSLDNKGAVEFYNQVSQNSPYFPQALYGKGLVYLTANKPDPAIRTFQQMRALFEKAPITDTNRVIATLSLARAFYQKQDWDASISAYAEIPRDTVFWHDALFEQSWAMLRGARFRSAMSNFHSLHSPYYEDSYNPESLLLRSIVYLYICKYDEMEKVLSLFEKTYGPVSRTIADFLKDTSDPAEYFTEIDRANVMSLSDKTYQLKLPMMVSLRIQNEPDVKRSLNYLRKLLKEKQLIESNTAFKNTPLAKMGLKILNNRSKNTRTAVGDKIKTHLTNMRLELKDLYEQAGFIRYEMINGQKEAVKKRMKNREIDNKIDETVQREFFVENGFEYYPFMGEFWLDEIGNFHYLGKSSCE
jgi:tetratricopeptide (TPR) repeat protein